MPAQTALKLTHVYDSSKVGTEPEEFTLSYSRRHRSNIPITQAAGQDSSNPAKFVSGFDKAVNVLRTLAAESYAILTKIYCLKC